MQRFKHFRTGFELQTAGLGKPEEILQSGIPSPGLYGEERFLTKITLSMGVVIPNERINMALDDIDPMASQAKHHAKMMKDICLVLARRATF